MTIAGGGGGGVRAAVLVALAAVVGIGAHGRAPLQCARAEAGEVEPELDDAGFERLPPPKPGEWRAAFPEEGPQFVTDYERDLKNKVTAGRRTIYVQPLGSIAERHAALLETVRAYCEAFFGCETKLRPPQPLPSEAWRAKRKQYDGDRLLRVLEPKVPAD